MLLCLVVALGAGLSASAATESISQVTVQKMTKAQYLEMAALGLDVVEVKGDQFEIFAKPTDLENLRRLGINYEMVHPDVVEFYASRYKPTVAFGGFRTYAQIVAYLDSLTLLYPNLCSQKFSIGTTLEGRDQWVVRISDNPNVDEDEPEVFYNSLTHAREPAGAACLMYYMDYLVSNYGVDAGITDLLDNRELYFLLVTNPDGYVYNEATEPDGGGMWRKNRRPTGGTNYGIDLNRNFSYAWGYDEVGSSGSPASETYRGSSGFSELETQHVRDFIISRHFSIVHNIHTYSNLVLWPWGYDRIWTDREDYFKNLGDSLVQFNGYDPGVAWTLYPTNGAADDWVWGDTISKPRIVSLTTEIGTSTDGFWPAVERIPVLEAENVEPNLYLAKIADNPYLIAPPREPVAAVVDSTGPSYNVHWHVTDPDNPAVSYRLYELSGKQTVTDDAESDHGYWDVSRMTLSSTRKHGGTYSWTAQQANQAAHWLTAKTPYLVPAGDSLHFWIWYNIEQDWDYFYAQVSTDGGNMFTNLPGNLTTNTDPNNMNLGNGTTGNSGGWVRAAYSLAPYAGQQVIIRLTYFTDSYTLGTGLSIDDIGNVPQFTSNYQIGPILSDTSFALTNKAPGSYWYRLKATDAQGQEGRYSKLVGTTVYQQYTRGDYNGDGTLDISDLSSIVDYLFFGGVGPDPFEVGDVNCDGAVDISDLQAIIDFLFFGVPLPSC
jgi:hypothetical protein